MDNIDQKNNNDQTSGDEHTNANLNTVVENQTPQTGHENDAESLQKDWMASENAQLVSEGKDIGSPDKEQAADFGLFSINQNTHKIEQIEVNSYKNMNTNFDSKLVKNELNDIDSASVVQSVGHILRRARIAKGMSIEDVSRQLRLSAQQIEAIEKENFERLPGRTFLRGFIRNYANLIQLDPIPLLQLLPESTPVISTYERTPFKNKQISFASNREDSSNSRLVMAIILVIVILGAYFIFENGGWNKKSDNHSTSSEVKVGTEKASVEIQLPLPSNRKHEASPQENKAAEIESNVKTEIIPLENKSSVKKTANATAAANEPGNLHFKFIADSWIKVIDGTGASLFEQIKKGGAEQVLAGKRPLSIVLGNASGVNLTYNGTEIDVASYRKQDGTARFTLE